MAWLEAASTVISAAQLVSDAAKSKGAVSIYISRIVYFLRNGKTVLPVFGGGGVGKSTIGRLLRDDNDRPKGSYDESWDIEEVPLSGEIPAKILVAPGQIARADRHWPEMLRTVLSGHAVGIINVVAYGYHSLQIHKISEHDLFEPGDTVESFVERYIEHRRQVELDMLSKILSGIQISDRKIWMITVVNKQDLWFDKYADVRRYYEEGAYNDAISRHMAKAGAVSFQHEFIPASLTLENLTTGSGEVLKGTSEGYDLPRHFASLALLFEKIEAMMGKGKS